MKHLILIRLMTAVHCFIANTVLTIQPTENESVYVISSTFCQISSYLFHTFPVEQFQITLATESLLLWSFCDHKLQQHKERKHVLIGTRATVPQITPTSMAFRVGEGMIKSISRLLLILTLAISYLLNIDTYVIIFILDFSN